MNLGRSRTGPIWVPAALAVRTRLADWRKGRQRAVSQPVAASQRQKLRTADRVVLWTVNCCVYRTVLYCLRLMSPNARIKSRSVLTTVTVYLPKRDHQRAALLPAQQKRQIVGCLRGAQLRGEQVGSEHAGAVVGDVAVHTTRHFVRGQRVRQQHARVLQTHWCQSLNGAGV